MIKKIAILGSTGSIGVNTLNVIRAASDQFEVVALAAGYNLDLLQKQIEDFRPKMVSVASGEVANQLRNRYPTLTILDGEGGLLQVASENDADLVVSALVGARGIRPTLAAIEAKKDVALANKEVLIAAGGLITEAVKKHQVKLLPVDSEHSAIFQLLQAGGAAKRSIRKLTITASGGPFLRRALDTFLKITPEEALKHPKWSMGNRITIDSSTMMNKGFEVIEAHWLFELPPDQIEVVTHPQSIVHGLVAFHDGNTLACLSAPDMKAPIAYALAYPERIRTEVVTLDLTKVKELTFESPDLEKFPLLKISYQALRSGGIFPCLLNAADEVAVAAFLDKKIRFVDIARVVESTLANYKGAFDVSLDGVLAADDWGRQEAKSIIKQLSSFL